MESHLKVKTKAYGELQMRVRCGAICLIAQFVALSDQETSASKQLAPQQAVEDATRDEPLAGDPPWART